MPVTHSDTVQSGFTPHEAAATLRSLEGYEETLTARAFGVTMIAFGIAGAATSLTYAFASDWFVQNGVPWLLSFLWFPWIFAAGLLTSIVWKTQCITLPSTDGRSGSWLLFAGFSALYIAIMGLLWWVDSRLAYDFGEGNRGLLTLGIFTVALAAFFQKRYGFGWMLRAVYLAALLLIGSAVGFSTLHLDLVPSALLTAGTGAFVWVATGAYVAHRG